MNATSESWETGLPGVRPPRQERARRTWDRVLAAGAALLSQEGYEGFSMSEVCRLADVSAGGLYDRVDSKEALFLAIHHRELERITAAGVAAFADAQRWDPLATPALVSAAVDELARQYLQDGPLLKAFILRAAVDPAVREEGGRYGRRASAAVVALLMAREADYPHPDPHAAVSAVTRLMFDSLSWRTAFGFDFARDGSSPPDHWRRELGAICRAWLLVATPAH